MKSVEIIIPDKMIINTRRLLRGLGIKETHVWEMLGDFSLDSSVGVGGKSGSACEPNICHNT